MKKFARIMLAILMVVCLAISITACKSDCDNGNHTWDEGTVTKAATCSEAGVKTFKCTLCDEEKTEAIPATGNHTPVSAAKAATCTEDGVADATKCSVCGTAIAAGTKIDKLGHNVTAWTPVANDSAKHEGTCTREGCGAKVTADHTPVVGKDTPATCTTDGKKGDTTCSDCSATIATGAVITKLGHNFDATIADNVTVTKEANCTEDGSKTVKCSRCDETDTVVIDKLGHDLAYEFTADTHTASCKRTGCDYTVAATAHTNTDGKCVCGGKLYTNFPVSDFATISASVSASKADSDEKYFAIGMVKSITDGYNTTVVITDTAGTELQIFWVYNEDGSVRDQNPSKTYSEGDVVVYYGYVNYYKGAAQLKNAWLVQLKDDAKINMAGIAITELVVPENVSEDFTLPTLSDATVVWTVEEGTGITIDGNNATVTPSKDGVQTVKIKAAVTVGTDEANKIYTVTVAKAGEKTIILDFANANIDWNGLTATSGDQSFAYGVVTYNAGVTNLNTGYLFVKKGYLANATAIPGSIVKVEYVVTSGAKAATNYYVYLSKTAKLANDLTGTIISTGKGDNVSVTGSVTATAEDGYNYFNISTSDNGQLVKVIITYVECDHETTTDVAANSATCTTAGNVAHKLCSTCGAMLDNDGKVLASTTVDALGHNFGELTAAVAPTCSAAGNVAYYHCDRCDKNYDEAKKVIIEDVTVAIDATAHKYVYAVDPTDNTKHIGTCEHNNEHKNEAADHTLGAWITTDSAEHWKVCSVCKYEAEKAAHDYNDEGVCACGKQSTAVTYTITTSVQGYDVTAEGAATVITVANEGTTDIAVNLTVTAPSGYVITSVKYQIGSAQDLVDITIADDGTGTFTVTKDALGSAETVSVVVTLEANAKSWKMITDVSALSADTKIVLVAGDKIATDYSSSKYNSSTISDSSVNTEATPLGVESATVFTLETVSEGVWALKIGDSYLSYKSGTNFDNVSNTTDTKAQWTISIDDTTHTATIANVSSTNRAVVFRAGTYNLFAPYATSNVNGDEYSYVTIYAWM